MRARHLIRWLLFAVVSVITPAAKAILVLSVETLTADAAEIKLIGIPGLSVVLDELGPEFERATGNKLLIQYGVANSLKRQIDAGDVFDVVVLPGPMIDELIKDGKIAAASRTEIGRVGIGVAIRAGAPKPDISSVEGFKRTMLNAKSISYTKDSGAGVYIAELMERLGIAEEMKPKTKLMGGGGQNPKAVAAGEVEFGLSVISDILPISGVEVLGPLPAELQNYVVWTAGVSSGSAQRESSQAFIGFLAAPTTAPLMRAKGVEPMTR